MKKVLSIMLVGLLVVFCFAGCTTKQNEEKAEWKVFLEEYEAVVDEYMELSQKYIANPTDAALAKEYQELTVKMAELPTKAETFKNELANDPEALQEYTKELVRISSKIAGEE